MLRTLKELESRQMMREIRERQAEPAQAIPKASGFEAATRPTGKKVDLKKQSQLAPAQTGAKTCVLREYENARRRGERKSKAKESQFPTPAPAKRAGKRGKSLTAANSSTG
jgi:hypothetical protein